MVSSQQQGKFLPFRSEHTGTLQLGHGAWREAVVAGAFPAALGSACPAGCVPLLPLGFPPARQLCLTACQKIQGTSFQRLKMKGTTQGRQFKCLKWREDSCYPYAWQRWQARLWSYAENTLDSSNPGFKNMIYPAKSYGQKRFSNSFIIA